MSIAGPFVCLDFAATPTTTTDGHGNSVTTYPALAGLFAITDLASYARSSDTLSPYRVTQIPAQHVLGGDDPANPVQTVTLHFADQATFDAVTDPVNALPPVPSPPPVVASAPPPERTAQSYRFKAALRLFPSPTGVSGRTLRDDVDAFLPTASGEVQDRWMAPEFGRSDAMLNNLALSFTGGDVGKAQALLTAIFDAADAIP